MCSKSPPENVVDDVDAVIAAYPTSIALQGELMMFKNFPSICGVTVLSFGDAFDCVVLDKTEQSAVSIFCKEHFSDFEKVKSALGCRLQWNEDLLFQSVSPELAPFVRDLIASRGSLDYDYKLWTFYSEKAENASDAADSVDLLTESDAEMINDSWEFSDERSLGWIRRMLGVGLGVCVKVDGIPVSWAIAQQRGSIGFLYTKQEHRRKGFAVSVVQRLARELRLRGVTPHAFVETDNEPSIRFFSGLPGFEKSPDALHWMGYRPDCKKSCGKRRCC